MIALSSDGEPTSFDVIVLGAGAGGCAAAARLSDAGLKTLLIERGDVPSGAQMIPRDVLDPSSIAMLSADSRYNAPVGGQLFDGRKISVAQGNYLGGSTAINGAYFARYTKTDFARWSRDGLSGWLYEDVLPYYSRSETDLQFGAMPGHGASGPVGVGRVGKEQFHEVSDAFMNAALKMGFPEHVDINDGKDEGVGPLPGNIVNGIRQNMGLAYILPRTNVGSGLTVWGNTSAVKLHLVNKQVAGVDVIRNGQELRITSSTVVVSLGAFWTPRLLMASGIGPKEVLDRLNVRPSAVLNAVGRGLTDHPRVRIPYTSEAPPRSETGWPRYETALHFCLHSGEDDYPDLLELMPSSFPVSPQAQHRADSNLDYSLVLTIMRSAESGSVTIRPDDVGRPEVNWNLFRSASVLTQLREGVRITMDLMSQSSVTSSRPPLKGLTARVALDDSALNDWILSNVFNPTHASSTCRMGTSPLDSVVDEHGQVWGVDGLFLADASVLPPFSSRGPSATTVMVGEKIGESLASRLSRSS
ncbi:GMC family oxidoreductase [Microbacterium sp. A94]|uniref:GMC family oxidoreductase n=1 Tax=Microbacterium sp. A94 TaxID=3450717 RepID=UPI003F43AC53